MQDGASRHVSVGDNVGAGTPRGASSAAPTELGGGFMDWRT
jgi:hypothetical protein